MLQFGFKPGQTCKRTGLHRLNAVHEGVKLGWPFLWQWIHLLNHIFSMQKNFDLRLKNCFLPGGVALVYFIQPSISVSLPLGCVFQMSRSQQFTFATSTHSVNSALIMVLLPSNPQLQEKRSVRYVVSAEQLTGRERHSSVCLWIIHSVWPMVIQTNQLGA